MHCHPSRKERKGIGKRRIHVQTLRCAVVCFWRVRVRSARLQTQRPHPRAGNDDDDDDGERAPDRDISYVFEFYPSYPVARLRAILHSPLIYCDLVKLAGCQIGSCLTWAGICQFSPNHVCGCWRLHAWTSAFFHVSGLPDWETSLIKWRIWKLTEKSKKRPERLERWPSSLACDHHLIKLF